MGDTPDVADTSVQMYGEAWSGNGDWVRIAPRSDTVVDGGASLPATGGPSCVQGTAANVATSAMVHVVDGGLKLPDGLWPDTTGCLP